MSTFRRLLGPAAIYADVPYFYPIQQCWQDIGFNEPFSRARGSSVPSAFWWRIFLQFWFFCGFLLLFFAFAFSVINYHPDTQNYWPAYPLAHVQVDSNIVYFLFLAYHHCCCLFEINCHAKVFTLFIYSFSQYVLFVFIFCFNWWSSAYIKLLILRPPTKTPSSSFSITLNTSSLKWLKRYGDSTHPCLVPFLICFPSEYPCPVRTTAACSQYCLTIIRTSSPSSPARLSIPISF